MANLRGNEVLITSLLDVRLVSDPSFEASIPAPHPTCNLVARADARIQIARHSTHGRARGNRRVQRLARPCLEGGRDSCQLLSQNPTDVPVRADIAPTLA